MYWHIIAPSVANQNYGHAVGCRRATHVRRLHSSTVLHTKSRKTSAEVADVQHFRRMPGLVIIQDARRTSAGRRWCEAPSSRLRRPSGRPGSTNILTFTNIYNTSAKKSADIRGMSGSRRRRTDIVDGILTVIFPAWMYSTRSQRFRPYSLHALSVRSPGVNMARWPSGLRRQTKVPLKSGPHGRGFESHSRHKFFSLSCHFTIWLQSTSRRSDGE